MSGLPSDGFPTPRSTSRLVWNVALAALLLLDVLFLVVNRPFHEAVFEGELGLVELGTFAVLLGGAVLFARSALAERGKTRWLFAFLGLGCFYWGMEEVSWGQTFFHWATPTGYAAGNYQQETNLHNERGLVGTVLNVAPRFTLLVAMIVTVLLALPGTARLREGFRRRIGARWLAPLPWCAAPAALAIASSSLNKAKPLGYRDFGENQELYIALFLLAYAALTHPKRGT